MLHSQSCQSGMESSDAGLNTFLSHANISGHPITASQCVASVLDVNITTALRLIEDFERLAIVKETTGYKRNRIFSFDPYIKLFR